MNITTTTTITYQAHEMPSVAIYSKRNGQYIGTRWLFRITVQHEDGIITGHPTMRGMDTLSVSMTVQWDALGPVSRDKVVGIIAEHVPAAVAP